MDLTLEQRLQRYLRREDENERRSMRDLRALSPEQRVLEGECIRNAVYEGLDGDGFCFRVSENLSKFRDGDAVTVGDGLDFDAATALVYGAYDADAGTLVLVRDRFLRIPEVRFDVGEAYVIDRRSLDIRSRMHEVVRAGFADAFVRDVLLGEHELDGDAGKYDRVRAALAATTLNEAQQHAGATAISTESLALVQGPPGTGKTRLLAEVVRAMAGVNCRIALTAFTHRAVDNALAAIRAVAPGLPLVKYGNPGSDRDGLLRLGVRLGFKPHHLPPHANGGLVVAGTSFGLAKLPADERFHVTVFDEAGQMPVPHAIAGMLLSRRWILFGDHMQLPPVITAEHADTEMRESVFGRLHRLYGSELLDTTYRMNDGVTRVVSDTFYGGRIKPADVAAPRRMAFEPGGRFDEVLDPERPVVLARVDHHQPGMRSSEEAALVADLVEEIVGRHGIAAKHIAVIAPFRAQVRAIRSAIQKRAETARQAGEALVVDTVERIQGQEREVVIVSLAVGDPDTLDQRASFFYSVNRLNVALSRARTKAIVVASRGAFRALPRDVDSLRAAGVFKRLFAGVPQVDLTPVYCVT